MAIWASQCGNDNWQVVSSQQPAVLFIWTRTALSSALLSPEFYLYRLSSGWPAANREETFISAHLKSTHGTARRKCLLTFDNIFHVREREILLSKEDNIVIPGRTPHVAAVYNFRVSCQLFLSCQSSDDGDRKVI